MQWCLANIRLIPWRVWVLKVAPNALFGLHPRDLGLLHECRDGYSSHGNFLFFFLGDAYFIKDFGLLTPREYTLILFYKYVFLIFSTAIFLD